MRYITFILKFMTKLSLFQINQLYAVKLPNKLLKP